MNATHHTLQVAIVGAGFAGVSTALHLQSLAVNPLHIHLFDPGAAARGVAYQPSDTSALLNVAVERMGLPSGQPERFWHWLQAQGQIVARGDFVPRQLYGEYLQAQLMEGLNHPGPAQIFLHRNEIVSMTPAVSPLTFNLQSAQGQSYLAHACVLAPGNFAPAPLTISSPEFYESPRYFNNPWDRAAVENSDSNASVLILGSGLTAVDCVLALRNQGHKGRIVLLSSHGQLPLAMTPPCEQQVTLALTPGDSLAHIVQQVRLQLRRLSPHAAPTSAHFQAVAMALRPQFAALWQGLSLSEQRQFLRHGMHIWGQMRHRLPPIVAQQLEVLRLHHTLQVVAGRVVDLKDLAAGVELSYRPRGEYQCVSLSGFQRVINATGPCLNYERVQSPLLSNLMAQGLVVKHSLGLGLQALASGQLLNDQQQPVPGLFTLGSTLRGTLWECTAVPEIREQAKRIATQIMWLLQDFKFI